MQYDLEVNVDFLPKLFYIKSVFSSSWYNRTSLTITYATFLATDLVDVWDELPFLRHIGFLVVGSEFALDGKKKDFKIPFLLESARQPQRSSKCSSEKTWVQDTPKYNSTESVNKNCAHLMGFSIVQYVVKAWSCCWTPVREFANFWLLMTAMVFSIQSNNSDARAS